MTTTSNHQERFNPFPGLRPFEIDEAHLFFGREGQSNELLRRLRKTRFLGVIGTSGSGKSSLVRAGLLPALQGGVMTPAGSSWRIAVMRPGDDPIGHLAEEILKPGVLASNESVDEEEIRLAMMEATLRRSGLGLVEITKQARMSSHDNLLIVVDQFEELFRFQEATKEHKGQDEAASFVKLLLEATKQEDVPIYVILTMRSDFLGECAQYRDLPEALNNGQYLIPRMTSDQRYQAIVGPVMVGGGTMTPQLVQRLLNDVGDDPDQLPILQHALMRTWEEWENNGAGKHPIDLPQYEAVGGLEKALSNHAQQAFDTLPSEKSQYIAEKIFKLLTEKGPDNREIRRPAAVKQISAVAKVSPQEVTKIIEHFRSAGRSFLVPPSPKTLQEDTLIDISHESLIRQWALLCQWVNEEAESSKTYRRLLETAEWWKMRKENLLSSLTLKSAQAWETKNQPNPDWAQQYGAGFEKVEEFLQASIQQQREDEAQALAQQVEKEAARKRELEQAKALAEAEEQRANAEQQRAEEQQRRAEEQVKANRQLQRLAGGLVVVFLVALGAAVFAWIKMEEAETAGFKVIAAQEKLKIYEEIQVAQKELGETKKKAEDLEEWIRSIEKGSRAQGFVK